MEYGLVVKSRLLGDLLVGDPTLLAEDAGCVVLADRGSGWRVWVAGAGGRHAALPAVRVRPVPGGWVAEPAAVEQLALGV